MDQMDTYLEPWRREPWNLKYWTFDRDHPLGGQKDCDPFGDTTMAKADGMDGDGLRSLAVMYLALRRCRVEALADKTFTNVDKHHIITLDRRIPCDDGEYDDLMDALHRAFGIAKTDSNREALVDAMGHTLPDDGIIIIKPDGRDPLFVRSYRSAMRKILIRSVTVADRMDTALSKFHEPWTDGS